MIKKQHPHEPKKPFSSRPLQQRAGSAPATANASTMNPNAMIALPSDDDDQQGSGSSGQGGQQQGSEAVRAYLQTITGSPYSHPLNQSYVDAAVEKNQHWMLTDDGDEKISSMDLKKQRQKKLKGSYAEVRYVGMHTTSKEITESASHAVVSSDQATTEYGYADENEQTYSEDANTPRYKPK